MRDKKGFNGTAFKPDLTFSMSERTFNDLSEGRISGFKGFLIGAIKIKGPIFTALKFDNNVIRRYNPGESYSKTKPKE